MGTNIINERNYYLPRIRSNQKTNTIMKNETNSTAKLMSVINAALSTHEDKPIGYLYSVKYTELVPEGFSEVRAFSRQEAIEKAIDNIDSYTGKKHSVRSCRKIGGME